MTTPQGSNPKKITEVIYATDYNAGDINAINYTLKIARRAGFELKAVHVTEVGKPEPDEKDKNAFEDELKKYTLAISPTRL